jgi:hypothetical protein
MSKPTLHSPLETALAKLAQLQARLEQAERDNTLLRLSNAELYNETVRLMIELEQLGDLP